MNHMDLRCLRIWTLAACLPLACAAPLLAADERNATSGITAAGAPLAMHGYDPVAFFTAAAPTPGSAAFAAVQDGSTYYFASQQNLDAFKANPSKYTPAFGGFCTFGVSVGKKFDGDPRYWTVSDGKLYLNLNQEIYQQFSKDVPGNIAKAQKQWQTIEHTPVKNL